MKSVIYIKIRFYINQNYIFVTIDLKNISFLSFFKFFNNVFFLDKVILKKKAIMKIISFINFEICI